MKLRSKILLLGVLPSLVLVLSSSALSYYFVKNSARREYDFIKYQLHNSLVNHIQSYLETQVGSLSLASERLKLLLNDYANLSTNNQAKTQMIKYLFEYQRNRDGLKSVAFYGCDGTKYLKYSDGFIDNEKSNDEDIVLIQGICKRPDGDSGFSLAPNKKDSSNNFAIYLRTDMRAIGDRQVKTVVFVVINNYILERELQKWKINIFNQYKSFKQYDWNARIEYKKGFIINLIPETSVYTNRSISSNYTTMLTTSNIGDLEVSTFTDESRYLNDLSKIKTYFLIVVLTIFIFYWFLFNILKSSFSSPVEEIKTAFIKIGEGDFSFNLNYNKKDEIGALINGINNMLKELKESRIKLEQSSKLVAIGQTTAMLAHDVRKPFSLLKSVLNMFETFKVSPSALEHAKTDIEKAINNVESMLNDIMDFSREVKVQTKPCCLDMLLNFSIWQTAQIHQRSNINLIYDLNNTYKPLADDERMARVFINIITNAVDAIEYKGKGSVFISSKDLVISDKHFIEVIIANSGPRFDDEDIPKLFSSFFTKAKKKGTGLGLVSAQKIVDLHEGTITARNMGVDRAANLKLGKDEGVEFIINIPASNQNDEVRIEKLPRTIKEAVCIGIKGDKDEIDTIIQGLSQGQYNPLKVLILEDESLYIASVKNTIKNNLDLAKILNLYDASTVEDALLIVEEQNITHAIVDIDLGQKRNGFDFIEEIKAKYPKVLCMVHSNRHLKEDNIRARELGIKIYVPKPLNIEQLVCFLSGEQIHVSKM